MPKGRMRRVHRYSNEFKITAVKLAGLPGTLIQDVAKALDIHPFMLSRWKKQYREGMIQGEFHPGRIHLHILLFNFTFIISVIPVLHAQKVTYRCCRSVASHHRQRD